MGESLFAEGAVDDSASYRGISMADSGNALEDENQDYGDDSSDNEEEGGVSDEDSRNYSGEGENSSGDDGGQSNAVEIATDHVLPYEDELAVDPRDEYLNQPESLVEMVKNKGKI